MMIEECGGISQVAVKSQTYVLKRKDTFLYYYIISSKESKIFQGKKEKEKLQEKK